WLHTKFTVLTALFALMLVIRLWPRVKSIVALVIPIAIVDAAWLWSFYRMYGVFDPQAPYGDYMTRFVRFENIPRSLLGWMFDQKFGLLWYSPVYVFAIAGVVLMLRSKRELRLLAIGSLATIAAFALGSARLYMWWGGASAPARFLMPIA